MTHESEKYPAFEPSGNPKTFYDELHIYRMQYGFTKTRGLVAAMLKESISAAQSARELQGDYADVAFQDDAKAAWHSYQNECNQEQAMGGAIRALTHILSYMDYVQNMYVACDIPKDVEP